jgi:SAM-dependent methyltransferase
MTEQIVDLGCGSRKTPGSVGVDAYPWPGVDLVADLDQVPWALEDSRFDTIVCNHVIEHVRDTVAFMAEVHRIGKHGAILRVVTPHFSSTCSWQDPTHVRHLSIFWYKLFAHDGYLGAQTGAFGHVSSSLRFGSSLRGQLGRGICHLWGHRRWEKHLAFRWPARDITTVLRVDKTRGHE